MRVRSGAQRVRLIGLEPVAGTRVAESSWNTLFRGRVVYLEFDRQRYDRDGSWLAYVFLPNGRMLNAELIRLVLARPRLEGRDVRSLDLFQETCARARAATQATRLPLSHEDDRGERVLPPASLSIAGPVAVATGYRSPRWSPSRSPPSRPSR